MTETKNGEFRTLTAQEFGTLVAMFRKALDWKQINLAYEAGIDERTIQRVEAGQQVSDDTRRQISRALKLPEDEFLKPCYMPTAEEIRARVSDLKDRFIVVDAQNLQSVRDIEKIMMESHGFVVDGSALPDDLANEVAVFKDCLEDWELIFRDISNVERVDACRLLLEQIRKIEGQEYCALYAIYATEDKVNVMGCNLRVAAVTFASKDRRVTQFVVPRHLREYVIV